jgi:erythromycin esterase-like protein
MMTFGTMNTRGAGMGILAEDITDGVSASSPNRFRPEYFRGIPPTSPAGSLQALATLDAQVEAKAAREAREREDKAVQAAQDAAELKHAAQLERSVKEAAAAQRKATAEVLNAQKAAAEEKRRLEREAKRNYRIGEDFYKGFGKAF